MYVYVFLIKFIVFCKTVKNNVLFVRQNGGRAFFSIKMSHQRALCHTRISSFCRVCTWRRHWCVRCGLAAPQHPADWAPRRRLARSRYWDNRHLPARPTIIPRRRQVSAWRTRLIRKMVRWVLLSGVNAFYITLVFLGLVFSTYTKLNIPCKNMNVKIEVSRLIARKM